MRSAPRSSTPPAPTCSTFAIPTCRRRSIRPRRWCRRCWRLPNCTASPAATFCSRSCSARRWHAALGLRCRQAITTEAGTSPRPAACSAPPPAAASCWGSNATQMVWALGTAATQAAGLCECLGTPAKSVGVGNAARNGLWSALLGGERFRRTGRAAQRRAGLLQCACRDAEPVAADRRPRQDAGRS